MKHEFFFETYPLLRLYLEPGEQVRAETGVMSSYKGEIELQSKMQKWTLRNWFASFMGKSLFNNTFIAKTAAEINFAPDSISKIYYKELDGTTNFYVMPSSYLVSTKEVDFKLEFLGVKSWFFGSNMGMLNVKGSGSLFLSARGDIETIKLKEGEKLIVDESFLVAFEQSIDYKVRSLGLKNTIFSEEGFVVELTGPGQVVTQTRKHFESSSGGFMSSVFGIFF
ncbi:MAG: TIGR00266 family protein [Aureispira sp.]|nr:TIGR00266 family protein [Aureispira sp.]